MTTREAIAAYADHLAAGKGGDMYIPPATPPAHPDTGRPRRLHLMTADCSTCHRCGFTVIDPNVIHYGSNIEPQDTRPLATHDAVLWKVCPFNCELVPPPAGKPHLKLASP